jgi:paraquat-inducible protein B
MFDKNSILDILSYSVKKTGESLTGIFSLMTGAIEYMYRDNTDMRLENGLLQLKNARDAVNLREAQLRESVKEYSTRAMLFKQKRLIREAKVMVKLYMLYDLQVKHCQDTISAIESHIISLETAAINKQVCAALKDSSLVEGVHIIDEDMLDNAVDKLSDRNETTGEFIRALGNTPGLVDLTDEDIEKELTKLEVQDMPDVPTHKISIEEDSKKGLDYILPKIPESTLLSTDIKVENGLSTTTVNSDYDSPDINASTNLINCVDNAVPS